MSGPVGLKTKEHRISVSGEAVLPPAPPPVVKPPLGFSQLPPTTTTTTTTIGNSRDHMLKSHDPMLQSHGVQKQQHVAEWLYHTQQHQEKQENTSPGKKLQSKRISPPKKSVYLSKTVLEFPRTAVGSQVTVKVRVCNRDSVTHHFTVICPSKPFSINHLNFSLE